MGQIFLGPHGDLVDRVLSNVHDDRSHWLSGLGLCLYCRVIFLEYSDEHDVDRIVMGSHCRSGAERFLLGGVAETVVKRAAIPVMIVR